MTLGSEHSPRYIGRMDLHGETVALAGHLHGFSFERLERLIAARGAKLTRRVSSRVTSLVVCSSAATRLLGTTGLELPSAVMPSVKLLSERDLLRALGLAPPAAGGELSVDRVAQLAGTEVQAIELWRMFDLLEGGPGSYGFRDLVAARQIISLCGHGIPLERIIDAVSRLRREGLSLSETRLAETSWGDLRRVTGDGLSALNGQLELPVSESGCSVDDFIEQGEVAEDEGDYEAAVRAYTNALRIEPDNAALCYSVASSYSAVGNARDARLWFLKTTAKDPSFAEAWFALGYLEEASADFTKATRCYKLAIQADPVYPDAYFNLALLLTKMEEYGEAKPLWERYLALEDTAEDNSIARRALTLCRISLRNWTVKAV